MLKTLLVCSNSTRKFFPEYKRVYIVNKEPNADILPLHNSEDNVIAIGGGAVIDAAKIICKNPIICFPTTAAGSSSTSHAVYWDGRDKKSLKVHIPKEVHIKKEFLQDLPKNVKIETTYDALSHCLDSSWSTKKTTESLRYINEALAILKNKNISNFDLVTAGNIAGKAIEICPTTILHSLSYPLKGFYEISHGKALGFLLNEVCKFMNFTSLNDYIDQPKYNFSNLDYDLLTKEALKYDKLYQIEKEITFDEIKKIYQNSNLN